MDKQVKNPHRAKRKLDMNDENENNYYFGQIESDQSSASTIYAYDDCTELRKRYYYLRDRTNQQQLYDENEDQDEDFSPDVSEYIPSPERFQLHRQSPSSSLGGDSQYIEDLHSNISRTPSTISNLSFLLDTASKASTPVSRKRQRHTKYPETGVLDITLKPTKKNNETNNKNTTNNDAAPRDSLDSIVRYETTAFNATPFTTPGSSCSSTPSQRILHKIKKKSESYITLTTEVEIHKTDMDKFNKTSSFNKAQVTDQNLTNAEISFKSNVGDLQFTITAGSNDLDVTPTVTNLSILSTKTNVNCEQIVAVDHEKSPKYFVDTLSKIALKKACEIITEKEILSERVRNIEVILQGNLEMQGDSNNENDMGPSSNKDSEIDLGNNEQRELNNLHENQNIDCATSNTNDSENETEPSTSSGKRISRKRHRDETQWKDNKSKKLKNSGKKYTGCRSGKDFDEKSVKPSCSCKKKCGERISFEERKQIMDAFYRLGDHEKQWEYIARNTKREDVKRITIDRKNNRTQTIKYYLPLRGAKVEVCKKFFLNTLSISETMVYTAIEKEKTDEGLLDHRGMHDNRPHKMSPATQESIETHIKLFPAVESHYTRKDTKRQYLSENLNISKMYRLYKAWFANQNFNDNVKMATKRQYVSIFNTMFNYSFFKPKKDLCATCVLYEQADVVTKISLQEKYEKHISNKEKVRDLKEDDKNNADKTTTTIAEFDLEKVLSIPQSEVGIFHYKRKYAVYNFTIYDAIRSKGYCFAWHMQIARRGAIEIGSCLLHFIIGEHLKGIKNISFYSDGCCGQNKNRYIFALYIYAAQKYNVKITHRFFETGHSQNEGDSMHSNVEREIKHKVIFTPDQMYSHIRNAKYTGNKFDVKEMEQSDFFDIKDLITGKNWDHDLDGNKVSWTKVMEVCATPDHPNKLLFKYDFDQEYFQLNTEIPIIRRQRRRRANPRTATATATTTLRVAYNDVLPVPRLLHADLMSLCRSGAIPQYYHPFYENMTTQNNQENDDDDL